MRGEGKRLGVAAKNILVRQRKKPEKDEIFCSCLMHETRWKITGRPQQPHSHFHISHPPPTTLNQLHIIIILRPSSQPTPRLHRLSLTQSRQPAHHTWLFHPTSTATHIHSTFPYHESIFILFSQIRCQPRRQCHCARICAPTP